MSKSKTKAQLELELQEANSRIAELEHDLQAIKIREGMQVRDLSSGYAAGRQSEQKLSKLLELLPVGISILDQNGQIVFLNPALLQILDTNYEDIRKGIFKDRKYLSSDGLPMPEDGFASVQVAKSGSAIYNVETGIVKENGETAWTNVSAVPVDFPDWKTVIVTADITERKRAEEKRDKLAERLDVATHSARIGIWDWDIPKNEIVWDDQMYALYGLKPGEFGGAYEAWLRGVHPEDRNLSNEISAAAVRGEQEYDTEFRVLWPDGSVHWLKAQGIVFYDKDQKPLRMIGVNYDISARKHIEHELQRSNADLEQFAYVASHDLQEPLRGVTGMVQLLQIRYHDQMDERGNEYIRHAVEAAERMQTLINDLLAFSRLDRRNPPIEPVQSETCMKTAIKNLDTAIRETQAVITVDPLPTVHADPTQLTQLFQNLIGNGIKFRGEKDPQIHVSAKRVDQSWQFCVRDNGIGIEPQYFERIFLVFQRLHSRGEYPGTGIGLAICKKIVERHGGALWVESQPGMGSNFFFTFPIRS